MYHFWVRIHFYVIYIARIIMQGDLFFLQHIYIFRNQHDIWQKLLLYASCSLFFFNGPINTALSWGVWKRPCPNLDEVSINFNLISSNAFLLVWVRRLWNTNFIMYLLLLAEYSNFCELKFSVGRSLYHHSVQAKDGDFEHSSY